MMCTCQCFLSHLLLVIVGVADTVVISWAQLQHTYSCHTHVYVHVPLVTTSNLSHGPISGSAPPSCLYGQVCGVRLCLHKSLGHFER